MLRSKLLLPLALLPLLAAPASAERVTHHLDDLSTGMSSRRAELEGVGDKASLKLARPLVKGLRILARPTDDYAREVKAASKLAKILEKKLAGETALLALLADAVDAYTADIEAARDDLASEVTAKDPSRMLLKVEKAIDAAELAPTLAKALKKLAKAAKLLGARVEENGGGGGIVVEPVTGETANWVISQIVLSESDVGLDMDGDGTADNALGGLGDILNQISDDLDINESIAAQLAEGDTVLIIQMWGIDDWSEDAEVRAGIMNALDTDGEPADNHSGTEAFDSTGFAAEDGHPAFRATVSFAEGGRYEADLVGEEIVFSGFLLPEGTPYRLSATATPTSNSGLIGFAIPMDVLFQFIEDQGFELPALVKFLLAAAADIDVDGDGTNESMSGAFTFDSVAAILRRDKFLHPR